MFSPIECRLTPSHLAAVARYGPVLLFAVIALGVSEHWLAVLVMLAVTLIGLYSTSRLSATPCYLRLVDNHCTLFYSANLSQAQHFFWTGRGRRNELYIRLELRKETEITHLMLWRDSFSDASWRALNAAYRVNSAAIIQAPCEGDST